MLIRRGINMKFIILFLFASTLWAQVPFKRDEPRIKKYSYIGGSSSPSGFYDINYGGDQDGNEYYTGFGFYNYGPNDVVPPQVPSMAMISRSFDFVSNDESKRENYLWITDTNGSGYTSDYMESVLVFLPRLNQFEIKELGKYNEVILPTGESVFFYANEKVVSEGVFSEGPVDLTEDRNLRKFPVISYHGKGTLIRSDARARDPRLAPKLRVQKAGLKDCLVDSKVFWTQEGFPQFQFIEDVNAYDAIIEYCGVTYLPNL